MKKNTCNHVYPVIYRVNLINSQKELSNINSHILKSIDKHSSNLIKISDQIWELAETAFNEHESSTNFS